MRIYSNVVNLTDHIDVSLRRGRICVEIRVDLREQASKDDSC